MGGRNFNKTEPGHNDDAYTASADIKACFYQRRIAEALSEYFCLLPVSAAKARSLDKRFDAGEFDTALAVRLVSFCFF